MGLLLLALSLRLLFAFVAGPGLRDDASYYVEAAQGLASGKGYLLRGQPTAYWPVGYPFFLSMIFRVSHGLLWARIVQSVLSVAIVFMSFRLALRLYAREQPARLTALILALMPAQIAYPSLMLGEVLFTALTLAGSLLLVSSDRWASVVAGGIAFALATYVRPIAFFLPFVALAWGSRGRLRRRLASGLVVLGVMVAAALPWAVRNVRVLHHPVWVSTNGGINLWMGNHVGATGAYAFTPEMERERDRLGDEAAFDAYARGRAVQFMREHPMQELALLGRKIVLLWTTDHYGVDSVFTRQRSWARKLCVLLSDLAALGVWLLLIRALVLRRRPAPLAIAVVGYITAVYAVTVAMPRYQFPAIPWLVIAAAAAVNASSTPRDSTAPSSVPEPRSA